MKKSLLLRIVVLVMVFAGIVPQAIAQVTTSAINGVVTDNRGALPGASIKAVHEPTGTVYGVVTNAEGRFAIANMRVGGPYTVTISYVGFQPETLTDIRLKLGESFPINVKLGENGEQLQEVVIAGRKNPIFNSKKTGAATNISKEQIESLPTLSRSLSDYYRLTPQSNGNSFGGANPRFNNITIDGAVNNDVFAASSTAITPGSGANTQPISLDAIQEIQVVLAPYDITYGNFTGAGINAITRSGTNKVEGSAYVFGRNQNTVGKQPNGVKSPDFTDYQYGFRLGGPIVKDKLFFFVNGELGRKKAPTTLGAGEPGALLTVAQAQEIADFVKTKYGYDVGGITAEPTLTQNDKIFARLDWNINSKNQLMVRHNYIKAFDDVFSRSATNFKFGNNGGRNNSKQNITVMELRSKFNESLSNNLLVGYTTVRDARSTFGALFPHVQINNINGSSTNQVNFGSERSSTANQLDQNILEITDNFKIFTGNHTFTVGTHNEFFKFRNLFVNNRYGYWTFNSLADFMADKPLTGEATYPITSNPGEARFSAAQLSFYGQDEIQVSPEFKLTAGMRVDVPIFRDKPERNPLAETAFGYRTDITPKSRPLVSPRIGFNYDVFGDKSVQLRGGSGIFTGRVPFVWLSNQFTNNGVLFGTVNQRTPPPVKFIPDPNEQQNIGSSTVKTYELNLIDQNFRLPQTFRSNLATDIKVPGGIVATLEAIYNQYLNSIDYADINIKGVTGTLNPSLSGGNDNRPTYGGKVNSTVTNALLLSNTSKGYSYTLTAQLQKSFLFGLDASIAYTYGEAKEKNSGASSTARSNWQFNQIVTNPNYSQVSYSKFDIRNRLVGSLNYGVRYGKNRLFGTSLGIFYSGRSGEANTYLYNGDLNGDGANQNDLIYIPRNASEIKLVTIPAVTGNNPSPAISPEAQWNALNAYIENDSYLRSRRGKYAERFGARGPWEHSFDARLLQDIGGLIKGTSNKLQLSVDVFNVGNLINKKWGRAYTIGNSNGATTLINYSSSNGGGFTFRAPADNTIYSVDQVRSRWAAQFGVRYLFN
ncbi:TonB-dependent receptor [Pedobacter sp. JY14-1]|uniref:TonB-dependent receptor n=1 Tax=Pedobacter sp. JY14-1 TaxID=3034151 RepID=UPI0023E161CB|nr:TonB-dependent receptor [Pedobacter sp. JY14-1]